MTRKNNAEKLVITNYDNFKNANVKMQIRKCKVQIQKCKNAN